MRCWMLLLSPHLWRRAPASATTRRRSSSSILCWQLQVVRSTRRARSRTPTAPIHRTTTTTTPRSHARRARSSTSCWPRKSCHPHMGTPAPSLRLPRCPPQPCPHPRGRRSPQRLHAVPRSTRPLRPCRRAPPSASPPATATATGPHRTPCPRIRPAWLPSLRRLVRLRRP